jgi:opacity protein-like surface antigen
MKKLLCASLASAALALAAGSASAAVYTATVTGTFAPLSVDTTGVFGPAGSPIGGLDFTAVFQFDPSLNPPGTVGGGQFAFGDIESATLSANSHTVTFPVNGLINQISYNKTLSKMSYRVYSLATGQELNISIPVLNSPSKLTQTGTFTYSGFGGNTSFEQDGGELITLAPTQIVVTAPAGPSVPEPATWAMMLLGFFGMGGLLRPRRTATA